MDYLNVSGKRVIEGYLYVLQLIGVVMFCVIE